MIIEQINSLNSDILDQVEKSYVQDEKISRILKLFKRYEHAAKEA